ncbi:hypothetical protein BKA63DRAFT_550591 [Paraphoma chrysanthemicola]|nr:hypothetical protein BKA63DRAFT_550591 [Paraphoma chrysanthemicola]
MSPTCSKAALRVLVSVLLASTIANAAALPHQVLDPRTPLAQDEFSPEQALQAVASAVSEDPGNFFDKISDDMNNRSAWQVFLDFVTRLFGPKENSDDDEDDTITTTVYVTPTPAEATSASAESTPTSDIVLPPGPPSTSTDVPTSTSPSEESSTTEEAMFSILPIGPMSEFINATVLTPVFSTGPETNLPLLTPSAGIPPFPANSTSDYILPTAVPITDEFSVTIPIELLSTGVPSAGIPPYPANSTSDYILPTAVPITDEFSVTIPVELLSTGVPSAVNSSAPAGTGLALPWAGNTTVVAINPTLVLTNPVAPTPVVNDTVALNTTISLTSIVVVTETIVPLPFPGTGTGAPVSAGTGFPISDVASPLWPNSTYVAPTILPGTGTGSSPIATALPLSGLPISSNVTNATISASAIAIANATSIVQLPITVTGLPGGVINITVTIPVAPFLNTTFTAPSFPQGTGALQPSFATAIPPPPSDFPDFPNTTYTLIEPTTIPFPSGTAASVGTILPIASLAESVLFPNTTIATIIDIATETATATLILPSLPAETDTTEQFPGLASLRTICGDPQIRVITLPLIDRFYGPAGYPSLLPFPGCTEPNARQAIQAPGLLNCSALGAEVQRCQSRGKKVLLSVKGDGLDAVSGNAGFGTPGAPAQPFGAYFGANGLDKRQKDKVKTVGKPSGVATKAASPTPKPGRPKPQVGVPEDFPGSAPVTSVVSEPADATSALPTSSAVGDVILDPLLGEPVELPGAGPAESALTAVIGVPVVSPTESARPEIFVDPIIDPATGQPLIIGAPVPIESSIPEPIFDPLLVVPGETATPEPFFSLESPPSAILLPAPSAPRLELPTPFLLEPLETPSPEPIDVSAPASVETPIAEPSDALIGAPIETATPPFEASSYRSQPKLSLLSLSIRYSVCQLRPQHQVASYWTTHRLTFSSRRPARLISQYPRCSSNPRSSHL